VKKYGFGSIAIATAAATTTTSDMQSPPASTTSNDAAAFTFTVDGPPQKSLKSDHDSDAIGLVFDSSDLLVKIICYIADGKCHKSMSQLSGTSKIFKRMTGSNMLWRELCYRRWKGKWGFHKRWESALADYEDRNVDKRPAYRIRAQ